jgi:cell division septal protein FtsQ
MRKRTGDSGNAQPDDTGDEQEVTVLGSAPDSARARGENGPPRPKPRTRQAAVMSSPPRFAPKAVSARRARTVQELRRRRMRPAIALLGLVVLVLAVGLGGYAVVNAGYFKVRTVEVAGASNISVDEIVLATGAVWQNLYSVDVAGAQRRVAAIPGIREARVEQVWPRRLRVTVEERVPVAVWRTGGSNHAVDLDGTVLDFFAEPAMLTIHQTDSTGGLLAGDRVDGDAVSLALRLRDSLPATIGQQATRFEWTQRAGLEITTDKGVRVRFGDGGDVEYKLSVWRGVLDQARAAKAVVTEIDLRFGDRVFYR